MIQHKKSLLFMNSKVSLLYYEIISTYPFHKQLILSMGLLLNCVLAACTDLGDAFHSTLKRRVRLCIHASCCTTSAYREALCYQRAMMSMMMITMMMRRLKMKTEMTKAGRVSIKGQLLHVCLLDK